MAADMDKTKLPEDLTISTMTVWGHLDLLFNTENIAKYIDLDINNVQSVGYGFSAQTNRTLIKKKKKNKKKGNKKHFYNQVTLEVQTSKGNRLNVKLFNNGSIQMTGCKDIQYTLDALEVLFKKLKGVKAVLDPVNKKIIEKPYVSNLKKLSIETMKKSLKVAMINSNFDIGFKINREKLYNLLFNQGVICSYDRSIHACVNIKFNCDYNKTISIFVFESGSIIITGATNYNHIVLAYTYINKVLIENYSQVVKLDFHQVNSKNILKYLKIEDLSIQI